MKGHQKMSGIFQNIKKLKLDENSSSESVRLEEVSRKDIAIIGMYGKISTANNIQEYWDILSGGKDCIRKIPKYRSNDVDAFLSTQGIEKEKLEYAMYAYMDDIDKFDYNFFSMSPTEASLMDPSQRLFLETAINTVEDAGYEGKRIIGSKTGVYVGYSSDSIGDYKSLVFSNKKFLPVASIPGNIKSIIAGRVSYILDLKGPAIIIDTACSSSLVAVHYACQGIRNGECDMAIAGGVSINLLPFKPNTEEGIGIVSSNARTRTFDDSSDGTGGGEGVAAILLKPLSKALYDGDNIYAVIKGSAINQDGSSNGITSPNSLAQRDVIISAWRDAGIDPQTISYIEAHGTGTKLGDPIEVDGIQKAFRTVTSKKQFCAVGSVKTNIGHLDSAAGIAGLIKVVLALYHKRIPPTLHFNRPNKKVNFEDSPLYINDRLMLWEERDIPRRCGVSAFGLSGTNCHMVLEEFRSAPEKEENTSENQILTLSAKTENALKNLLKSYIEYAEKNKISNLDNVCYTSNTGRGHYNCRLAVILGRDEDFKEKLSRLLNLGFENITIEGVYYGIHTEVSDNKKVKGKGELTRNEKKALDDIAVEKIDRMTDFNQGGDKKALEELGILYIQGADIPWEKLYEVRKMKKVSLPVYPFENTRCWLETGEAVPETEELFHTVYWKREELELEEAKNSSEGCTLVLKDNLETGQGIIKRLRDEGKDVIEVEMGNFYVKISDQKFFIGNTQSDYDQLIKETKGHNIATVLHFASISSQYVIYDIEQLNNIQKKGIYSLFYLVKAILSNRIKQNMQIILVSKYANEVTGMEKYICPENAALFGLGKVVSQEYEGIGLRCIDIDDISTMDNILREIRLPTNSYVTAYREGARYVETIDSLKIPATDKKEMELKKEGAYLVTGGMGEIGLTISRHLALKGNINLVLIGRSDFPEREKWEGIIKDGNNMKLINKLKLIREIEKYGSRVVYYCADVSKMEEMQDVLTQIRRQFGCINGILHCAGVAGDGFLLNKDENIFKNVVLPKINGTWILDKLTENDSIDFFVLFSSITSILGAPGQGDYTAANAYLDAFALYRNRLGKRTMSINWTAWQETGMTSDYGIRKGSSILKTIAVSKALEAFYTVLCGLKAPRVVIGEPDYDELAKLPDYILGTFSKAIMERIKKQNKTKKSENIEKSRNEMVEVKIIGGQTDGYSDVQRKLARLWAQVLGLKEVSIYDNFHELGGNSILAIQLLRDITQEYHGSLDITDIFAYPTIAELAGYIEKQLKNVKELSIDDVLEKLAAGDLSIDEVESLMESVGNKK